MSTVIEETVEASSPFQELIQSGEYEYSIERGQIINGRIVEYDKDGVLVDVGSKSEAFLPMKEVADSSVEDIASFLPVDSEYEFYILRDEVGNAGEGRIIVSYKRVAQARVWNNLEEVRDASDICEANIQEVVKGGVVVEIDGVKGFIPASHLRVKGGSNNPQLVGQTIPCTILEIDRGHNKLILSQKLAISKLYAGEREELMRALYDRLEENAKALEAGEANEPLTVNGEVVRITDFGAFIKIEDTEMDGLLPLSEISWRRLNHPSDVIKIGDQLTVQVLNVIPEQSRISLSLKRFEIDPWDNIKDKVNVGDVIEANIVRHNNYGAFVTAEVAGQKLGEFGFEAFLPYDDMKAASPDLTQDEIIASYELDTVYKVAIKKIKPEERRMVFSTKVLDENNQVIPGTLEDQVDPEA